MSLKKENKAGKTPQGMILLLAYLVNIPCTTLFHLDTRCQNPAKPPENIVIAWRVSINGQLQNL